MENQRMNPMHISDVEWDMLSREAWNCQKKARVLGTTKVGSAVLTLEGKIFAGCNVEHRFRSHDIHAEVSAISSLVSSGCNKLVAILVVTNRKCFTPCGGCMDWVFELGGPYCIVGFQNEVEGEIKKYQAKDLMPYYPE